MNTEDDSSDGDETENIITLLCLGICDEEEK